MLHEEVLETVGYRVRWTVALRLLQQMHHVEVRPNTATYNSVPRTKPTRKAAMPSGHPFLASERSCFR